MARNRDESRSGLTELAQKQGLEVTPGQLEAAGLLDQPEEATEADQAPEFTGPVFWRVRIVNTTVNDAGAHNHVVRAPDKANAWEVFRREMGVISVDETVNRREITPATELEYMHAHAKRFRVDLREHRQLPEGSRKDRKGFFPLTWQPPGGAQGKYLINEKGETKPAE